MRVDERHTSKTISKKLLKSFRAGQQFSVASSWCSEDSGETTCRESVFMNFFHWVTAHLFILSFLKRPIGHIIILLTEQPHNTRLCVTLDIVHPCECGKQTEGRHCPHLMYLSREAPGSPLTPLRCHNIYIPTRDTTQGRPLRNQHADTLYLQHTPRRILQTGTPVKLKRTCMYVWNCWNAIDIHIESDSQDAKQQIALS